MEYPPQLTPVQAWLLGYLDSDTLRDQVYALEGEELLTQARAVGRSLEDPDYAADLIAEAQRVLEPEPPSGPGAGAPAQEVVIEAAEAFVRATDRLPYGVEAKPERDALETGVQAMWRAELATQAAAR